MWKILEATEVITEMVVRVVGIGFVKVSRPKSLAIALKNRLKIRMLSN